MTFRKIVTTAAIVSSLAWSSFALASAPAAHRTHRNTGDLQLATVNGDPVTSKDLLALFTDRHGGHAKFLGGEEEARSFLKVVIEDRLLVQEAYEIGLDQDATAVALVSQAEANKISDLLIRREIEEKAKPTKEEIESIRRGLTFFIHARQIAVAEKSEADEIRRAILGGADVDQLARSCSLAESRGNGGHIVAGWGQHSPAWEEAVFELHPGDVSEPIETDDGWEVVVVNDRVDMTPPPSESVANDIQNVLSKRKLEARKRALSEELWNRYHVKQNVIDVSPAALIKLRISQPETMVASWDGGGTLVIKDLFEPDEIRQLSVFTPKRVQFEVEKRIRATVNGSLVPLEGKARKLDQDPEIVSEIDQYRDYVVESLLYRDHIFRDLNVADDDLRSYFDAHKDEFLAPEERHVAQIMVATEADAVALREKLAAGADFTEAARKYSKDFSTAMNGGDLGWITPDKVPPQFKEVLSLPAGGLTKATSVNNQWHIVKVLEIKPGRQQEFESVKEKVRERVLDQKKRAARQFWIDKLRAVAKIEIDGAAIKAFIAENRMDTGKVPAPAMSHAVPAGEIKPTGEAPRP